MRIARFFSGHRVALSIVVGVHALCTLYFAPPTVLSRAVPVLEEMFGAYAYHMDRALRAYQTGFGISVYDPQMLAGRPAGAMAGSGAPLFVAAGFLGHYFRSDPGRFFNALIFLCHAALPVVGFSAARALSLTRPAAVCAGALFSVLWYFDSLVHWTWCSGRLPWALGGYVSAAALAFGFAAAKRRALSTCAAFVVGGFVLSLAHPVLATVVLAVLGVHFVGAMRRERTRWPLLCVSWGCAIVPIVVWRAVTGTALGDEPSGFSFSSTLAQLWGDTLDLRTKGAGDVGAVRALFRVLCFVAAAVSLTRWTRRDSRTLLLAPFIAGAFVFGYSGGYVRAQWSMDPHLWLVPASFTAALPAAEVLVSTFSPSALRQMEHRAKVLLVVAALGIAPRVLRTVLWFFPAALPARVLRSPLDSRVSVFLGPNEAMPAVRRHVPIPAEWFDVARFLETQRPAGRVLVFDRGLAAFFAGATKLGVMGPLSERGAAYAGSDPTPEGRFDLDFARYLERYAVEWVVVEGEPMDFERRSDALLPAQLVSGMRCYHAHHSPDYVAEGSARIESIRAGSIRVVDARADDLVLRFHFDAHLRCRPHCALERAELPGDAAGFLRVPHPPPELTIYDARAAL